MSKLVIFTISTAWDDEAAVWSGHCDDILAAADAPTLDELLGKVSAMALDLLPDNHPDIDPASLFLQVDPSRKGGRVSERASFEAVGWYLPGFRRRPIRATLSDPRDIRERATTGRIHHAIHHQPLSDRRLVLRRLLHRRRLGGCGGAGRAHLVRGLSAGAGQ
jgi:hypothetical protein